MRSMKWGRRLKGHLNSAEHWLQQADNFDFPNPARTEILQTAFTHALLAHAIAIYRADNSYSVNLDRDSE